MRYASLTLLAEDGDRSPGDLVTADFPGVIGIKRRPAVVISTADYHTHRPDVILGIITTQIASATTPTDYVLRDWSIAGLNRPSAFPSFSRNSACDCYQTDWTLYPERGGLEIEFLVMEGASGPLAHGFVLFVSGVAPGFEEPDVAGRSADVLGRAMAGAVDAGRVFEASVFGDPLFEGDEVQPAVAEVVVGASLASPDRRAARQGTCRAATR